MANILGAFVLLVALLFFTGLTFCIRLERTDRLLPTWGGRQRPAAGTPAIPNPPLLRVFRGLFRSAWQPRSPGVCGLSTWLPPSFTAARPTP